MSSDSDEEEEGKKQGARRAKSNTFVWREGSLVSLSGLVTLPPGIGAKKDPPKEKDEKEKEREKEEVKTKEEKKKEKEKEAVKTPRQLFSGEHPVENEDIEWDEKEGRPLKFTEWNKRFQRLLLIEDEGKKYASLEALEKGRSPPPLFVSLRLCLEFLAEASMYGRYTKSPHHTKKPPPHTSHTTPHHIAPHHITPTPPHHATPHHTNTATPYHTTPHQHTATPPHATLHHRDTRESLLITNCILMNSIIISELFVVCDSFLHTSLFTVIHNSG